MRPIVGMIAGFLIAANMTAALLTREVRPTWHPQSDTPPQISRIDRTRLLEVFRIGDELQDHIWPGWSQASFAVLFVTPQHEFLIRHPKPTPDFGILDDDPAFGKVYYRKRTQNENLLAAFPAVGGVSTIVVGRVEATGQRSSTRWAITLLHEHFHQWTDSQPNFYADALSLGLARGDQTGMWMLNYPFAYDDAAVQKKFSELSAALASALRARGTPELKNTFAAYLAARKRFQQGLSEDDYKYFSFQVWKEGVARYTELRIARLAAEKFRPSPEFAALPDFESFDAAGRAIEQRIFAHLDQANLAERKRVSFYSIGAGESLLLDAVRPTWQQQYLKEKFFLERCYPEGQSAAASQSGSATLKPK